MTESTDDQTQDSDQERNWKELRAQAEESKSLKAELAELRKRESFRDAGLDLTNKQHARFAKGYDGELDADTIKATALDEGFLAPPAQAQPPVQERAAFGEIAAASQGSSAPEPNNAITQIDDLTRTATAQGWDSDRYNAEMMALMARNNMPTAFDGQ